MTEERVGRPDRKVVALECWVDDVSQRTPMRLLDLSVGGGFIGSPTQLARGDRIHVTFVLEGQEVRCAARVAHVQPARGFGFAFLEDEMADDASRAIERFVDPSEA
jgi:hypothetical protein